MKDPILANLDRNYERTTELLAKMREEGRRNAEAAVGIRDAQREMILDMREMREEMRVDREQRRVETTQWVAEMRAYREEARKEAQLHHEALQQTNESMALMLDELRSWGDRRK